MLAANAMARALAGAGASDGVGDGDRRKQDSNDDEDDDDEGEDEEQLQERLQEQEEVDMNEREEEAWKNMEETGMEEDEKAEEEVTEEAKYNTASAAASVQALAGLYAPSMPWWEAAARAALPPADPANPSDKEARKIKRRATQLREQLEDAWQLLEMVGHGGECSPRHVMPFNSIIEGLTCG